MTTSEQMQNLLYRKCFALKIFDELPCIYWRKINGFETNPSKMSDTTL